MSSVIRAISPPCRPPPTPRGGPADTRQSLTGLPALPRLPSTMHGGVTIPAGAVPCICRVSSQTATGLPLVYGGPVPSLPRSRPVRRSLHAPARRVAKPLGAAPFPGVPQSMSIPPRTALAAINRGRLTLGGIRTHQKNVPSHGATGRPPILGYPALRFVMCQEGNTRGNIITL